MIPRFHARHRWPALESCRPSLGALLVTLLLSSLLATGVAAQSHWPSFRNDGSGTITLDQAPTRWSPTESISWIAAIPGYGQSAPVVWGDRIFVTSSDGPWQNQTFVHAFELASGNRLWSTQVEATTPIENYFRNSRAAPTSVVDSKLVVSFFPSGDVTALDHGGRKVWTVSLFEEFGKAFKYRDCRMQ